MWAAIGTTLLGLFLVALAVGIPYWLTHRHMRPMHDPAEAQAYQEITGRTGPQISAGKPGRLDGRRSRALRHWQAAQADANQPPSEHHADTTS